ncbi:MAG: class IV adenylate cyclase [Tissierellaceae bacterium]
MAKELEVKILNIDIEEMEDRIRKLGASYLGKEYQINTLIDSEENHIENSLDAYMRIRETRFEPSGEKATTLTLKKNIKREGIRENIEVNTDISDKIAMLEILKSLGYVVKERGEKERISYILGKTRFDLDRWDKDTYPYPYMEIEVEKEEDLDHIIDSLAIPRENISIKSIVELRREAKLI